LDHEDQILILENLQTMMQNKHKYAFRRIMRKKLQIFNLHYKTETVKKFITKKMLTVNFKSFLLNSENSFPLVYKNKEDLTNKWITKGIS
jgi:hypothetical protein